MSLKKTHSVFFHYITPKMKLYLRIRFLNQFNSHNLIFGILTVLSFHLTSEYSNLDPWYKINESKMTHSVFFHYITPKMKL